MISNDRSSIRELLAETEERDSVTLFGWVRTRRDAKAFSFLEVNDGSCLASIQVIIDSSVPSYEVVKSVNTGAAVRVAGRLVESPGKGQDWEIQAAEIELIGSAPEDYPLQKKRHSDEFLRTIAHLRARTNKYGALFRIRSRLSLAIHQFFQNRGFNYIHTPIITGSDCEGAGDMFRVTTFDLAKMPQDTNGVHFADDFFGKEAHLTVSGQLAVETYCLALDKVYTFGPTFRSENSNTSRHMSEFWMIEPEIAFADLEDDMQLAEEMVRYLISFLREDCREDFELFARFVDKTLVEKLDRVVDNEFIRLPYTEAIDMLSSAQEDFEFAPQWGADLQSEHERYLTEQHFKNRYSCMTGREISKPFTCAKMRITKPSPRWIC